MTRGKQPHLGPRAFLGLALCGAALGFTVPAIASSLIQQERRQPAVRLLPAPHLPRTPVQPTGTSAVPIPNATLPAEPTKQPRALTPAQLKQKNPPPRSRILPVPRVRHAPAPVATPSPSSSRPTTVAPTHKKGPNATTDPRTSGGALAPAR
jgi:hypothetical protein